MKLTDKRMKLIAGLFCLLGTLAGIYTNNYNKTHADNPNNYGKYAAVFLFIVALFFLMPWGKNESPKP